MQDAVGMHVVIDQDLSQNAVTWAIVVRSEYLCVTCQQCRQRAVCRCNVYVGDLNQTSKEDDALNDRLR